MTRKLKRKSKVLMESLDSSGGNISYACKVANVSRETFYRWLREDQEFKQQVEDLDEKSVDFAESKLKQKIADGDMTAIIFYLKCKGKRRGYIERTEHINTDMVIHVMRRD